MVNAIGCGFKKVARKLLMAAGYSIHKSGKEITFRPIQSASEAFKHSALLKKIFKESCLEEKPLVLVDIGASGGINPDWLPLAPFAILVGFDADEREMKNTHMQSHLCKKQIIINNIVSNFNSEAVDFYLTKSPYCSSMLKPNSKELCNWSYSSLFEVERIMKLKCESLKDVLAQNEVEYIDWIKTDSQGVDLRIITSLSLNVFEKLIAIEFEPGFINAYENEDMALDVMNFMATKPFWMTKLFVKGAERIDLKDLSETFSQEEIKFFKYGQSIIDKAPGWAEIGYLRQYQGNEDIRTLLLMITFALVMKQEGYAFKLTKFGTTKFDLPIFNVIQEHLTRHWKLQIPRGKAL